MASIFKPDIPQPPQEDPEAKRLRDLEQQRAERERTQATQEQLRQETLLRNRRTGIRGLLGGGGRGLTSLLGSG